MYLELKHIISEYYGLRWTPIFLSRLRMDVGFSASDRREVNLLVPQALRPLSDDLCSSSRIRSYACLSTNTAKNTVALFVQYSQLSISQSQG